MGREIKRVPLDFAWPKDKTWEGYINPHYEGHCTDCKACKNGYTTARARLNDLVSLIMVSGEDSVRGACHPWLGMSALLYTAGITPSKDMVELTAGLAGRQPSFLGHDGCDNHSASLAIIKAAGLPKSWGICKTCKGEGSVWDSKENRTKANRWRRKEPPNGKGYQLWETVTEGSPISPVFAEPEALAHWLTTSPDYKWKRNDAGTTYDQWLKFIRGPGWAPSMVMGGGKVQTGVQAVA